MSDFDERPLADEVRREIEMLAGAARELLDLPPSGADPRTIVGSIDAALRTQGWLERTGLEPDEAAIALGALWGEQLARAFGWQWVTLTETEPDDDEAEDEDDEHVGVVPSDRRYLVFPTYFIRGLLEPEAEVTALLTFNMIASGNLPPAETGEYIELGAPEVDEDDDEEEEE